MESVIRGITIYFVLLVATRLSGRRSLAQITPFDFVLLLIIAETTQQALMGDDYSLTNSFIVIVTLFGTDVLLSHLKQWSPRIGTVIDGTPTVLISAGQPDEEALRRTRISLADVLEAARMQHGLKRLDEIDCVVLEVGGALSVIPAGTRG